MRRPSFLEAAKSVLESHRQAMSAKDIVRTALEEGILSDDRSGRTPWQTMKSKLSTHIRRYGANSPFVRTRPGRFYLRSLLTDEGAIYEAPPLRPPAPIERVLIFPSEYLNQRGFQGVKKNWRSTYSGLLQRPPCDHMERLRAERDDHHKQVLTYIMVKREGQVLAYKRGTYNRVEEFLRGAHCIGFGGHVTEADITLFNVQDLGVLDSAIRELSEELELPAKDKDRLAATEGLKIEGILNDDSSSVGRRHFAFVLSYEVSNSAAWDHPQRREKSITQLRWINPLQDAISIWNFEYWSQLLLRTFFGKDLVTQPAYRIRRAVRLRPPSILCVLGGVGSGKSEATRLLKKEYGYAEINSGRVLATLLGIPPIPKTSRAEFQRKSWKFISRRDGPTKLAMALWREIQGMGVPRVLIDGIRQRATLEALERIAKKEGRRLGRLFVHTPPDIAFHFYNSRSKTQLTIGEFLAVRDAEVEKEVPLFIADSDAVLYNWIGKTAYGNAVRELMKQILDSGAG